MRTSNAAWSLAGLVAGGAGLATSYLTANVMNIRESPVVAVAELVIRQLLLDVLLSRPDAPPMPAILAGAEGLLDGLRPDLEESVPGPRAHAVRAEGDRS